MRSDKPGVALDGVDVRVDLLDALEEARNRRPHPCLLESHNPADEILAELETVDPVFRT